MLLSSIPLSFQVFVFLFLYFCFCIFVFVFLPDFVHFPSSAFFPGFVFRQTIMYSNGIPVFDCIINLFLLFVLQKFSYFFSCFHQIKAPGTCSLRMPSKYRCLNIYFLRFRQSTLCVYHTSEFYIEFLFSHRKCKISPLICAGSSSFSP